VSATDQRFRAGGNPGNAIDAAAIAAADMRGLSLMETLRREVPGIRVRTVAGGWSCLEYRLLAGSFPIGGAPDSLSSVLLGVDRTMNTTCRGMAVFLDVRSCCRGP
jgi:hypothetical protein